MITPNYADITALVDALSSKRDPYSHHAPRVAALASRLSSAVDLPAEQIDMVFIGAHLHDIGKLVQKSDLINIPRRLTPAEFDTMRLHTLQGHEIIESLNYAPIIKDIVLHHHENWDGTGYPDKLRGEAISIHAQIVHIVDVFDAMTNPRPYRKELSFRNTRAQMEMQTGAMFEEKLLNIFFRRIVSE